MPTSIKFSNLWSKLLDRKHHTLKNYNAQSSANQILKDKTEKQITQEDLK